MKLETINNMPVTDTLVIEKKELKHFEILNNIDVSTKIEKKKVGKDTLSYLSWSWAWTEVKKNYPDANYEVKMFDGLPYIFDSKTGYMVFTSVTIENVTHTMFLPVMDGANRAMKDIAYSYFVKDYYTGGTKEKTVDAATMFDINKTIMRCLVKNIGMFGLGLYIYAGEDLPESTIEENKQKEIESKRLPELKKEHERFEKVKKALIDKKTTIEIVKNTFYISDELEKELKLL